MTTGEKLIKLRKEFGYTQEQLADILHVSRQAISRWESDLAFPETEKLIKLSELYNVTVDYLLKDSDEEFILGKKEENILKFWEKKFEYKSKKMIGNLPLVHINIGLKEKSCGVISIGLRSKGIVSIGLFSIGIVSLGLFSLGLISLGLFAIGLMAIGTFALGIFAIGAIAFGVYSLGAIAVGNVSVGALAIGNEFAYGDHAFANKLSVAITEGNGYIIGKEKDQALVEKIKEEIELINPLFRWFCKMFI